jgi:hypothetical protein
VSRTHRAKVRREARAAAGHGARRGYVHHSDTGALNTGWCATEDDLPELRQGTHDTVIKLLGTRRTSGVRWVQFEGEEAYTHLERLVEKCTDPKLLAMYRQIRGLLREHGGWVVTAMAEGSPP